jgi:hypothetical protein
MPFLLLGSISVCVVDRFENRLAGKANGRELASMVQNVTSNPRTSSCVFVGIFASHSATGISMTK